MRPDGLSSHGELRAAGDADGVGDLKVGEDLLEGALVDVFGVNGLVLLGGSLVAEGPNLSRTAQDPGASQVDVTLLLEILETESLQERKRIVVGVVVVPLEALGVMEQNVSREGIVAVDDVPAKGVVSVSVVRLSILTLYEATTYVRKTMASRPLFTRTVNSASGSSTT